MLPPEPSPERNFGFLLHDVARLLRVTFDRRSRALGLTRSQWWVLNHLYVHEGITQSELADLLDIEKATLGRLLDRLEGKGWVERRGDPLDRRAKRVHLTGQVQDLMRSLREIAAGVRADALDGLPGAERERFIETLLRIKGNLVRMTGNGAHDAPARSRERADV